jgi:ParB family transcriptional regulator, chromosome partitioning protein
MTPEFKTYRVRDLKHNPKNPRGKSVSEQECRSLSKSLKQRQWMPLIVLEPELIVLDGNLRLAAALSVGIETLYGIAVTLELTPGEIHRMIAQLDLCHQPFSEIARGKLWRSIRDENGWTNAQLAEDLGVSAALLTKIFSNLDNPDEIQALVEAGTLSLRDGYYLSRVEDLGERLRVAQELAAGRLQPEAVVRMVRKPKANANGKQIRSRRISCPLPSGVNLTVSGALLSLDELSEALSEAQREVKKARDQSLDCKTFQAVMQQRFGRHEPKPGESK